MTGSPPRYAPERPLPPYAFLPGRAPHPRRDPDGHSHGVDEPRPAHVPAARWSDSADYRWGVDLYNHGFPWEAHEAWEGLWLASREAGDARQARFLRGLIQCAAAVVKARLGDAASAARLADRGLGRLRYVAATAPRFMGVDLSPFIAAFERFVDAGGAGDAPLLRLAGAEPL